MICISVCADMLFCLIKEMPMDLKKFMFIIKGDIKDDVVSYQYDRENRKMQITYSGGGTYPYNFSNVKILSEPACIDEEKYIFRAGSDVLGKITEVYEFRDGSELYYRIFFEGGSHLSCKSSQLLITENVIKDSKAANLFEYFKKAAHYNSLKDDDGNVLLESIYDRIDSIDSQSVLASYFTGSSVKKSAGEINILFPFGCNLSQITAVENALSNNLSIIEGPPRTGKTQTILNIITNLIASGKTVMVVSNNNSATNNVFEKLQKYGYDYVTAQMGSSNNKTEFIKEKQKTVS